ncbi:MAG: hypothetical protein VB080_00865 [Propionicimonas sp.]|uniref:hypothetical protein n=1 Tax=Propionicimonas sp. TaxID=1955623 RepID=UPI002B20BA1F|nr:hypothetical protein [Propionicimonas sp.]MEA4942965.1 hypothetical protein [Propionicimonas sp.]MEA5055488.1 hypothetical protein [Propionicimonas sp.]MEA5118106.1 hypothetical protein [Propionicimonas sp.]
MSLFDQQPMGPVPARKPILVPPDPELEAEVPDPAAAEVELVGPLPDELSYPVQPVAAVRPVRHWSTVALAVILLVLLVGGLPFALIALAQAAFAGSVPEAVALVILAVMGAGTVLVWLYRRNLR